MTDPETTVLPPRPRLLRRFFGVAGVLLACALLTFGGRLWHEVETRRHMEARQAEAVARALDRVESDFNAIQQQMQAVAQQVAQAPEVTRGLREAAYAPEVLLPESLVRYTADLSLSEHLAVEIYDVVPRLVGWEGFAVAMPKVDSLDFMQTPGLTLVGDREVQQAVALWWPVVQRDTVLGAVRVVRMLRQQAPVENQYVRSYHLSERWQTLTGLPVQVAWNEGEAAALPDSGRRSLRGMDGTVLGQVVVAPPTPERMLRQVQRRYAGVTAFWVAVLLGWLFAGLWMLYRRQLRLWRARRAPLLHLMLVFLLVVLGWIGLRYALLLLDVPGRWFSGTTPGAWLFDPTTLASAVGGGLARSVGALLVTALFGLALSLGVFDFATRLCARSLRGRAQSRSWTAPAQPSAVRFLLTLAGTVLVLLGIALIHAFTVRAVILDSTIDYFSNTGLLPDGPVLLVFILLLLGTLAAVLLLMSAVWLAERLLERFVPATWPVGTLVGAALAAVAVPLLLVYWGTRFFELASFWNAALYVAAGLGVAVFGRSTERPLQEVFSMRGVLLCGLLLAMLLYPLLYQGMQAQRDIHMREAAADFVEREDPRVLFAIEEVLREAGQQAALRPLLLAPGESQERLDSLATAFLRSSLLASIPGYESHLGFFTADSVLAGQAQTVAHGAMESADVFELSLLMDMYRERAQPGPMVEPLTGGREPDRVEYGGTIPLHQRDSVLVGWAVVRAEPRAGLYTYETPFPRILVPSYFSEDADNLSLAEFRDGVLTRTRGDDFGRYRLAPDVARELEIRYELWRSEQVGERTYRTYYRRQMPEAPALTTLAVPQRVVVIAVRSKAIAAVDHLYFLLRLTVAALFVSLPVFLVGLVWRWRSGLLAARSVRFRDRVLNRFLLVGVISVAATGLVGHQVIVSENNRAIQDNLRRYLDAVEQALLDQARDDEPPFAALDRVRIDSLASRIGLDVNIYRGYDLIASSRPQLVRQRLINQRLPAEAYEALFLEGQRYAVTEEKLGSFPYTVGYHALTFDANRPNYSTAVLSLPEEERIREERARMTAYLFGALLLLLMVVMITATLLANRLAQPIVRLRSGLEAVGKGQFFSPIPVTTRDEFGDLVQTFNNLRQQLDESRRALAQQERELAWREMARQVAHEIKNPLTPMKLSVQHIQRAWLAEGERDSKFGKLFQNITERLIEQIEALTRIANEFSSFARLPRRRLEHLDLNEVVQSAVALLEEEALQREEVEILIDLWPEALVVEADAEELRRAYINLVKNAMQAIPEGEPGRITVRTQRQEAEGQAWAVSTVTDTGTGIPEAVREKIFQPNFSTKTSGMGLGLAIVKKSVEDVRGEIAFETGEGTGTTFRIRLPLA